MGVNLNLGGYIKDDYYVRISDLGIVSKHKGFLIAKTIRSIEICSKVYSKIIIDSNLGKNFIIVNPSLKNEEGD